MNRADVAQLFAVLLAAFPHARVNDQTSIVWEQALADLEYEHADLAVRRLILTEHEFMPSIAKVRAAAIEYRDGSRRAPGDAWGDVRQAVGKFGIYRVPVFDDPMVARAVAALGWREVCNAPEGDASYRKQFIDLYTKLGDSDALVRSLQGALPAPRERARLGSGATLGEVLKLAAAQEDEEEPPWED